MKKLFFIVIAALALTSCMKEYDDVALLDPDVTTAPFLKVAGATMSGDTAYAAPGIYLKFWVDQLPASVETYIFNWDLDGGTSTASSPEKKYQIGIYNIDVDITPINGAVTISRSIVLVISDEVYENTLILLSATPLNNFANYEYRIAMKSAVIYNYANNSGDPWTRGDFTGWDLNYLSETTVINGILYIVDYITLPTSNSSKQRFTYGKGETYAYAPGSSYWVTTATGEGVFEIYLTNGQMSQNPITGILMPGDNGDSNVGVFPPTIRTEIRYSSIPHSDSIRIFINYSEYANGSNPFISRKLSDNNWLTTEATIMTGGLAGWCYATFALKDMENGLYWRFGANISSPTSYGLMYRSKYYLATDNMLALQMPNLK